MKMPGLNKDSEAGEVSSMSQPPELQQAKV